MKRDEDVLSEHEGGWPEPLPLSRRDRRKGMRSVDVSERNLALLDQLANRMMTRHPSLWSPRPSNSAVIGYAVSIALKAPEVDR
jgi:hypothetical protein